MFSRDMKNKPATTPIKLQPLNAPLSAPVRALLEFDALGERNQLVYIYSDSPELMEKLESCFPLFMVVVGDKVLVEHEWCNGGRFVSPDPVKEEERKKAEKAKWDAEKPKRDKADAELADLLSHPSFFLAILPDTL